MIITQQDSWLIAAMVLAPGIITGSIMFLTGLCKVSIWAYRWFAKESKQ